VYRNGNMIRTVVDGDMYSPLTFTDSGLTPGTSYLYKVIGRASSGVTYETQSVQVATTGTAPTPTPTATAKAKSTATPKPTSTPTATATAPPTSTPTPSSPEVVVSPTAVIPVDSTPDIELEENVDTRRYQHILVILLSALILGVIFYQLYHYFNQRNKGINH
jgi:hypothetical protein